MSRSRSSASTSTAALFVMADETAASRVTAIEFGEDGPVSSNWTQDGRAANRRIVLGFEPFDGSDA